MEHFKNIEKRNGCDFGMVDCDLHPNHLAENEWPRVGKSGFDNNLRLNELMAIAYGMNNPKPNIIIKGGPRAKWYLKYSHIDELDEQIARYNFRPSQRNCTMYIITWE